MDKGAGDVFFEADVAGKVVGVISEATKLCTLVTPYLKISGWRHAENAILLAIKRNVDLKVIVRDEPKQTESADVRWLLENGVKVYAVERLHAKVYLNEKRTLVTSMNLTEESRDSLEIAMIVRDDGAIRRYVASSLLGIAQPISLTSDQPAPVRSQTATSFVGTCIRCEETIPLDPDRPLCDGCYAVWAEYRNQDYQEAVCHACGQPADVSYGRPLCRTCYGRFNR